MNLNKVLQLARAAYTERMDVARQNAVAAAIDAFYAEWNETNDLAIQDAEDAIAKSAAEYCQQNPEFASDLAKKIDIERHDDYDSSCDLED